MGFKVSFTGLPGGISGSIEAADYSVDEAATPLAAGDSSGQVGTFTLTFAIPDASLSTTRATPWSALRKYGESVFLDSEVRIDDSRKGFTLGRVNSSQVSRDGGTLTLSGVSRLGLLNVYGVQAGPFVGNLRDAFTYYLSLANVSTGLFVDDDIANTAVVFPGWNGELWYYLKQMAAAIDCDISLVSGVILLRAIRKRVATNNRDLSRSLSTGGGTLAQAVEVYQYNNRQITNELVYPPGGWTSEVEVLNVNAGEEQEYTLDLSSSLTSIQSPVMQTFVASDYSASSVYTIVANDGLPVSPTLWANNGGSLTVEIAPDTSHLIVRLKGATRIPTSSGAAATNFSVALGSDTTGNRYSTLRIVGTGVAYDKVKHRIQTGVPASKTATDVGVTIDNPFISTADQLYRTGTRAARDFTGTSMNLSGTVTAVNKRGDSGQANYPTYTQVQSALTTAIGGTPTYAQVQSYYASLGLTSYEAVRAYWFNFFRNDDADQVFGNVQGARIYDAKSRKWYRIRQGSLKPGEISFGSADDDLTYSDVQSVYAGRTYAQVQTILSGLTYQQVDMAGALT